jgi:hypothetical protein
MQNLNQSTWDHEILYADRSSGDEKLLIRPFFPDTQKYEYGGWLKFKMYTLFYGHNSRTVALRQTTFGAMKDHKHTIFI